MVFAALFIRAALLFAIAIVPPAIVFGLVWNWCQHVFSGPYPHLNGTATWMIAVTLAAMAATVSFGVARALWR